MTDSVIKAFDIPLSVEIRGWDVDGEVQYDWALSNGNDESDMTFASAEEAERDIRRRFK